MTHRARAFIILVGLLLAGALAPRTAESESSFSGGVEESPKQQNPKDTFATQGNAASSPTQGTRAKSIAGATAARPPVTISDSNAYLIGPQDVIDIQVFGVAELSGTVEVGDNGMLQLPLLGETQAAGKTEQELQRDITARLGAEYLQNPQVRVTVKDFKSRTVIVSGAISKPGVYPLTGKTSLLQIVATAGGFQDSSDSTVLVLRQRGGKRLGAMFDVSEIQAGTVDDPELEGGDKIVAGKSEIKAAYGLFLKALPVLGLFAFF
jgi:polysaccharide export outer membrane protein